MPLRFRSVRALVVAVVLVLPALGSSQDVDPTDMSGLFESLTPEQRQAVMQSLAGGGTGSGGVAGIGAVLGGGTSGGDVTGGRNVRPTDAEQMRRQAGDEEEREPLIPVLKGEDWVIVEIDFHLPPRPVTPSMSAAQSLLNQPGQQAAQQSQALQALQAASAAGVSGVAGPAGGDKPPDSGGSGGGGSAGGGPGGGGSEGQMSDEQRNQLGDLMDRIRNANPYQLSHDGALTLPGFAPMPLLGLNEDQATLRLKIEPAFRGIDVRLTRLPLKKTGPEALKPFGYDLFRRAPSTFAPVTNVPVPSDYVLGPGDVLDVHLYGTRNRALRLLVGRDGRINLPDIGPVVVGGELFDTAKETIESRVARQMVGVRASVAMSDTRAIRVFVVGDARHPGSYTVSGLGTITSALFAAGGVQPIGSLRRIQLKRGGALVRELDLYDLLLRGDTSNDTKLLQGDVILIPPVGSTVGVDGEVHRPAIYELKQESSVADVITLAGGLTPQADAGTAMLTRIDEQGRRVVLRVDVTGAATSPTGLRNGDTLRIATLRPTLDAGVVLQGHLYTPGAIAYRPGMHLSDAIHSVEELRPGADIHYVLIRRELPPDRRIVVLSGDLAAALESPGSKVDPELSPHDRITVFDLSTSRDRIIQPVLDELRLQGSAAHPSEVVHVDGKVKVPGDYPLEADMTVADLIRAGGGLSDEAASRGVAELTRYQVVNGETRRTQVVQVDIAEALKGKADANLPLAPFDDLSVKQVSQWDTQESVTLIGEVRFPGRYSIKGGDTLRAVIDRAGGLSEYAFPEGSVFSREELKKREQQQLEALAVRMQSDLTALAIRGAAAGQSGAVSALGVGQSLLGQLRTAKASGRMVIDLPRLMREPRGSSADVVLRSGDKLIVPKFQQQVTVIGEVQNVTSHLYGPGLGRDEYIMMSGGMTRQADHGRIYVVRANGSVVANAGNSWFQHSNVRIKPGDTIVVPMDTERYPPLPFWQAVTGILYNLALGAAAIRVL
jgi:polysaccharide biosynthesis/export protein